jgi:pyridoxal phosphate enzyme (YggS family)
MKKNIIVIKQNIAAACERSGRNPSEVTLIAVSKTKPISMIEEAYEFGIREFGENKVQELSAKHDELIEKYKDSIKWHIIGHLQRNKVKQVIDKAVLIHSVDSLRLGLMIEQEAAQKNIICDILIEVNIAQEDTKFGVSEDELLPLLLELIKLPHIRVRGLMTIAPYDINSENNRGYFSKLRQLFVDIKTKNIDNGHIVTYFNPHNFDILSMGMTGDYVVAIEEGATMVRVGTGIFGDRNYLN